MPAEDFFKAPQSAAPAQPDHLTGVIRALQAQLEQLQAQLAVLQAERDEPAPLLSDQQKRDLQLTWPQIVCAVCGEVHPGKICPRVKDVRFYPNGTPSRMILWPQGQWKRATGTHTADDVWGDRVAPPPAPPGQLLPPNQ